jgi:hypothetical protein
MTIVSGSKFTAAGMIKKSAVTALFSECLFGKE